MKYFERYLVLIVLVAMTLFPAPVEGKQFLYLSMFSAKPDNSIFWEKNKKKTVLNKNVPF